MSNSKNVNRMTVRIPDDMHDFILEYSERTGFKQNDVVKMAILQFQQQVSAVDLVSEIKKVGKGE